MQVYLHVYYTLQYKHYITALQVHDVEMASYWRLCDVITSHQRHFDVMCLLGVTKTDV